MAEFDPVFEKLIEHEGGYSNHPDDPGGETMYGVTARVARAYGYQGPMKELPKPVAKNIAKQMYWDALGCDEYPQSIAARLFDTLYNGGKPVLWAQQALGIKADGKLGQITRAAIKNAEPLAFSLRFLAFRLIYLTRLSNWPSFSRGWSARIADHMRASADGK